MKKITATIAAIQAATLAVLISSCGRLSDQAKEMVGNYYIPVISEDQPLMELNGNGKCVVRAIRPGVLVYEVPGSWNVENDTLIMKLKPESITWEGDSSLIGDVPPELKRAVVEFTGVNLTLKQNDILKVYRRRVE